MPPGATCGVQPGVVGAGRLHAVAAVDEQQGDGRAPVRGDDRRAPDDADDHILQAGVVDRRPERRQRVHPPGAGIDDGRVVVLPAGLVLLAAVVVVDGVDDRAGGARRGAEPHRRTPAVRADLEQRQPGHRGGRVDRRGVQRVAFVRRHEPLGRQRVGAQPGRHRRGYHVSQWMMVSGSGRSAGLKSVPAV